MAEERIGDYGNVIGSETIAAEDIAFNTFVKRGASKGLILQADADEVPCGVAEYDYRKNFADGTTRTGWKDGEELKVKNTGEAILTAGAQIAYLANITTDDDGKAVTAGQGDAVYGIALTAAAAEDDLFVAQLLGMG